MSRKKIVLLISVLVLLSTVAVLRFVRPAVAQGPIFIRSDGSVDPPTAPIQRDGNLYAFTSNINESIYVERDNIVVDGAGYILQGTGSGGGIFLSDRSNVTIKNMKITEFNDGIRLDDSFNNSIFGNNLIANLVVGLQLINSSSNRIYGNIITNNDDYGIWLWAGSTNNSIYENNITDNRYGIWLEYMSFHNSISGNNIINNDEGIQLRESSNNTISGNNITGNNKYGIKLEYSSNNIIYHNNFINNGLAQADSVDSINNVWDDGYPSGGNYWSDYTDIDQYSGPQQNETGSDGIWDHPYFVDGNNRDNYPLVPEFVAWTPMLIMFIVLTVAMAIYKQRLPKKPIH
jgi:parallel beta-helix repeat protein